ncbi:hypothetical protein ACI2OX_03150 [Bacillus sp. N9]
MSEQSAMADFQLVALIPEHAILEKLPFYKESQRSFLLELCCLYYYLFLL